MSSKHTENAVEMLVRLMLQEQDSNSMEVDGPQDQRPKEDKEARILATRDYCMRILGSRMTPITVTDDIHISDLIKKQLMRDDDTATTAMRFSHLYSKLSGCDVLTKKWSVLYFLLAIKEDKAASSSASNTHTTTAIPVLGLQNLNFNRPRERTETSFTDTTVAAHSRHGSIQGTTRPSSQRLGREHENGVEADMPPEVDENDLLRDLIFVFQGIDGKMIRFGAESGTCEIDHHHNVSASTRSLVARLSELGWLYKRIDAFVQQTLQQPDTGLVVQSFCSAIQDEFTDYFKLIAVLESHIARPDAKGLTLKRLLIWTLDSLQRLRLVSVLVDCCADLQGGALVSTIHDYTQHGDPVIQKFINHMLEKVSAPFYEMLSNWIYKGELHDSKAEFFIAQDPEVGDEDLWQKQYYVRQAMLPAFIGESLAKKILSIGKSLSFLRRSCNDAGWLSQNHGIEKKLKYGDIAELESSIDTAYVGTSQRLLHLLFTKFKLLDHLTAIKRYLLLGQGDFVQHMMETLGPSLSQPATTLFRHNLTGTLETAIRSSNAQYDDPDILRRLDVRLLELSPGDSGWEVFSLDYHVDSPISTIFTPAAMHQYLKMFNFLWKLKRVEHALSSAWRRQTTSARAIRPILELVPELHQCRIVCSEMIHFVYQLQYYILFEVLECSWDELQKAIQNKATDLDSLIEAHSKYLRDVISKGLLAASHDANILPRLMELLATILDYKVAQDNLYNYGMAEIERRERLVAIADRRTKHGQWGLTDEDETLDRIPEEQFEELVPGLLRTLNEISMQFKQGLSMLLLTLSADGDSDLRFLSFRLDFNEFYLGSMSLRGGGSNGERGVGGSSSHLVNHATTAVSASQRTG